MVKIIIKTLRCESLRTILFFTSLVISVPHEGMTQTVDQHGKGNTQNIDIKKSGNIEFSGGQNVFVGDDAVAHPTIEYYKEDVAGVYYGIKNDGACHISYNCINTSTSDIYDLSSTLYLIGETNGLLYIIKKDKDEYIIPKLGYKDLFGNHFFLEKLPISIDTTYFLALKYEYSNKLLIRQPVVLDVFHLDPSVTYKELKKVNAIMHKRVFDFLSSRKEE